MAIYIYDNATGTLVSYCSHDSDPVAPDDVLAAKHLTAVSKLPPTDDTHQWDPQTKTVVVVQAPLIPRIVDNYQFILSFTPQEYDAISRSADLVVKQLLEALRSIGTIDMNGVTTKNGVGYLASVGLLTPDRAVAILAGP